MFRKMGEIQLLVSDVPNEGKRMMDLYQYIKRMVYAVHVSLKSHGSLDARKISSS